MGNNQEKPKIKPAILPSQSSISKNSFEFIQVIGKGGFGKVWKVFSKKSKEIYALKEMSKTKIIDKKSEKSVINERNLLSRMNHP